MRNYFRESKRVLETARAAQSWLGTPWTANSHAKGFGVSCHNLPFEIYREVGFFGPDFPRIISDPTATRHTKSSVMVPFVDMRTDKFMRVKSHPQPGDLLGIRIYSCVDHLGLMLEGNQFIHTLMHKKTSLDDWRLPPWSDRIDVIWRPIEL